MRFLVVWTSLGVCALALNGCFTVGDDDTSGGPGGQKDETGGTTATGAKSGSGGSTGGTAATTTGGSAGSPAVFGRGGSGGSGGAKEIAGGSAGKLVEGGGSGGSGAKSGTGGSDAPGGSGDQAGADTTGGTGGTGGGLPSATCQQVSDKLQSCSLFDGPLDCTTVETTPEQLCVNSCFEQATCDTLTAWYCSTDSSSIDDCTSKCETFTCNDGSSIPDDFVCDGGDDCSGGEDEKNCLTCDGGYIVPTSYICDGTADCDDGADEKGCPTFKCKNGDVIAGQLRCDGTSDCSDGSDEKGCPVRTCPLPTPGVACAAVAKTLKTCGILPGGVATGCEDLTPYRTCEKTCYANATCSELNTFFCEDMTSATDIQSCLGDCDSQSDYYPCKTGGSLVASSKLCDGYPDCEDGSDEANCEFTCAAGKQTIDGSKVCDGYPDCSDGSDESGCSPTCN